MAVRRADGKIESQEITVRQMLRESAPLWEMADYCRRCPVNRDDAFGCFASINYPLSAQAERWLAEVGKEAGKAEDLRGVLLRFLADQQETGKNFARLRQDPDGTYLEAKQPGAFTVESVLVPRTTFTTDMLLETMFAVGVMSATHQQFLLYFSGGVHPLEHKPDRDAFDGEYQVSQVEAKGRSARYLVFHLPDDATDDRSIAQLKEFFRALFDAYATDSEMAVDY